MKPLVGISCCSKAFGLFGTPNHAASDTYVRVTDGPVDAVPVLIPANGEAADIATLVRRLDGLILTGSRSNVHPNFYQGPPHAEGTPEDLLRDEVTLRLIRAAVEAGLPVLAVCRGMQELNVALGGSLHQRLQDLPGHLDHSTPMSPNPQVRTGKAHDALLTPGGWLHRTLGTDVIAINSLHNQGVDRLAPGLVVDALAPDGVVEGVRAPSAPGFVAGVQWHPEYDFAHDTNSRRIFEVFGEAVRAGSGSALMAAD